MFKISNQVLDCHDDTDRTILRKLASINPKINMITTEERQALPDHCFALSVLTKRASKLNKFPIESHDSTWLSNQYFNETHFRLPKQAAETAAYHIKQACGHFKIAPTLAVSTMAKKAESNVYGEGDQSTPVTREQSVDLSKFAQVDQIVQNETVAQTTFATPAHCKVAGQYFEQYAEKMPLEKRAQYARALQKRAGELGCEFKSGKIMKYAGSAYSADVDAHLAIRKTLVEGKFSEALDKMAMMKKEMAPQEFAQLLHGFDKRAGLERHYGSFLTDPYQATFSTKSNPDYLYKKGNASLTADAVQKLATEKYAKIKDYLGKDVADGLKAQDGSQIFESLPNDAKELIVSIADGTL